MTRSNETSRIALITGGGRGLGKNMALHLADKGADIFLTYVSGEREANDVVAQVQAKGRRAAAFRLDVGDSKSFDAFAAAIKAKLTSLGRERFDILINNAGVGAHAAFADTSEAQFDQLVNVHLKGTFFLTQKLLPLIADGGRILNVSSGLTRIILPGYASYGAIKGAVEVLTRYLAAELGSRKISVNVLAPGAIETDFGGGAVRDNVNLNKLIASQTALGRVGLPDDIGGAVSALLAPEAHWMTGQRIEVSGGQHM
jgi:NAD(P)-dependent dehydrogenase (short-subunit alcohol dehydrogenase family)